MSSDWFTSSKSKDGGSLWVLPATQTFLFLGLCDVKAEQFFCLTIYKTAAVPYEEDLKYQTQDSQIIRVKSSSIAIGWLST